MNDKGLSVKEAYDAKHRSCRREQSECVLILSSSRRAAVLRDDAPGADILQVWLDVSSHPAGGEAQAEEIHRSVLAPIFEDKP